MNLLHARAKETNPRISGNDTTEHIQKRSLLVCLFCFHGESGKLQLYRNDEGMKKTRDGLTVVICDDDRFIVSSIREELDGSGYNVIGDAANGLELIRLCEKEKPDLVIVDIEMPVMGGIDAAKELTERNLTKCVIFLTSFDDAKYVQGAIETGASGYLTKPINPDILIPTIESCIQKSAEFYEMNKKVANINKRIETRGIIEKAQLLLMENHNMSESDAYGYIKNLSKERSTSMADIAEIIVAKFSD